MAAKRGVIQVSVCDLDIVVWAVAAGRRVALRARSTGRQTVARSIVRRPGAAKLVGIPGDRPSAAAAE